MQKEIITGPAGCGKTYFIINLFLKNINNNKKSFVIVPTLEHAERIKDLIRQENKNSFNLDSLILTFDKFAKNILNKNLDFTQKTATEMLKILLIQKAIENIDLDYFFAVKDYYGFYRKLMELFVELKQNCIYNLDELVKQKCFASYQLQKINEINLIYKKYQTILKDANLCDDQDYILTLIKNPNLDFIDNIFIDGFYSYTKVQKQLIKVFKEKCNVFISLNKDDLNSFKQIKDTYRFLLEQGFLEVKLNEDFKRSNKKTLVHLRDNFFNKKAQKIKANKDELAIISCLNQKEEIKELALELKKQVVYNKIRFCDIAVIMRSLGTFKHLIKLEFNKLNIPYLFHEGEPIATNPLILLIKQIVAFLNLEKFEQNIVNKILNSNYCKKNCQLEIYLKEMFFNFKQLKTAEEISFLFLESLKNIIDFDFILKNCPNDLHAFAKLETLVSEMNDLVLINDFNLKKYFEILLENLDISLYNPSKKDLDQVQIYDCNIIQQKEYKVVFVLGFNQKYFPAFNFEDFFLKDQERILINGLIKSQFQLLREKINQEDFFIYTALTRAVSKIYILFSDYDNKNKKLKASYYLNNILNCYDSFEIKKTNGIKSIEDIVSLIDLKNFSCLNKINLKDLDKLLLYDKNDLSDLKNKLENIEDKQILSAKVIEKHLETKQYYSISEIASFVACPYNYFATYILKIKDFTDNFEASDLGTILHSALELFFKDQSIEIKSLVDSILANYLKKFKYDYLFYQTKQKILKIIKSNIEIEKDPKYCFEPFEFEKKLTYDLLQAKIKGKIDRIDKNHHNEFLLIDYKTSLSSKFDYEAVIERKLLQLPFYAIALMDLGFDVAGIAIQNLAKAQKKIIDFKQESFDLQNFRNFVINNIQDIINQIKSGIISSSPFEYSCLQYCQLSSVCKTSKLDLIAKKYS